MVTHTWENLFRDLVAAVVADALDENTFDVLLGTNDRIRVNGGSLRTCELYKSFAG